MAEHNQQTSNGFNLTFRPHPLARNPHFQTIASSTFRHKAAAMCAAAREIILEAGEGVRLQGFYSPQPGPVSKGLVLLLHGWLGHANSGYNIAIGEYLYEHGYSIFRLNLRDHGDTHHLNPGLFRGDLLDETFAAARYIAQLESQHLFYIIGSSLGGSFAARLAWRHSQTPLPNLSHTLAINPAFNPHHTTQMLDQGPAFYLAYFRRKWRRSLSKKLMAYPALYDFSEELAAPTCLAMTDAFVRHYSPYADTLAYFNSYTVTPAMLASLQTPVTIITAIDDPIVPVADFAPFDQLTPWLQIFIQPYGGHVGFINLFPFQRWVGPAALAILENEH